MTIVTLQAVDLTPYGKPVYGRLPTGLGKPAAGFPQLHSLDDDEVHYLSNSGLTLYRGTDCRLVALPVALAGLVMLALTADRGGNLVYRHGVGVTAQHDVGEVD